MEPPPSYLQATTKDHWSIISSFVASQDLCSAALVCRRWNQVFMPQVWGSPASHFGTDNDDVYVALVRFKRVLAWARASTRELTHTLVLPPAQAEIYDGPRANWLDQILSRLPRLQSLLVSGLPFFDHWALLGVGKSNESLQGPLFHNIRLIEAQTCYNATPQGLLHFLGHFPNLVYLNLSRTPAARDPAVLQGMKQLPCLQILKLEGIGMKDEDLKFLCRSVGLRLRSLDVRDNRLTDNGVRLILQECMTTTSMARQIVRNRMINSQSVPLSMQEFFGYELPTIYKSNDQDDFVRRSLLTGFRTYLAIEDVGQTGLTHLYISGNPISVHGIAHLLRIGRLNVLDVGTPSTTLSTVDLRHGNPAGFLGPGSDCLIPLLEKNGVEMTHLRLNHTVITNVVPSDPTSNCFELEASPSRVPLPTTPVQQYHFQHHDSPVELQGDYVPIQEMPADTAFELEGSPVPLSPVFHAKPPSIVVEEEKTSRPSVSRSKSLMAPEPLITPLDSPPSYNFGQDDKRSLRRESSNLLPPDISPLLSPNSSSPPPSIKVFSADGKSVSPLPQHQRTYSGLLSEHDAKIAQLKAQPHSLLPSTMPSLRTLVLTDVPSHSPTKDVSQNIISFIRACADEANWSRQQSKLSYALPPGQSGAVVERNLAHSLFGLRRLVLEIRNVSTTTFTRVTPRVTRRIGKSSVEDADCETFWAAAADDFSFFDDQDECGVPESEMRSSIPLEAYKGKMVVGDDEPAISSSRPRSWSEVPVIVPRKKTSVSMVETVAEIARFRSDKRARYQLARQTGEVNPYVEGYWDGEIVVVRNTSLV